MLFNTGSLYHVAPAVHQNNPVFNYSVNDLLFSFCASGFLRLNQLDQWCPKRRRTNRKLRKKVSSHWSVIYVMLRLLQIICELEVWREAFGVKGDNKNIFSSLMCSIRSNLYHCGQKSFSTLNGQEHSGSRVMISERFFSDLQYRPLSVACESEYCSSCEK